MSAEPERTEDSTMSEAVDDSASALDKKFIRERAGTELVNKKHVDTFDVDIGRQHVGTSHLNSVHEPGSPGWLGNPHPVKEHGKCEICSERHTREESIRAFRRDFREKLRRDTKFRKAVKQLEGGRLACYCVPEHCHGDIILEFIDRGEEALLRWENEDLRDRVDSLEEVVNDFKNLTGPAFAKFFNSLNGNEFGDEDTTVRYGEPEIIPTAVDAAETINERAGRLKNVESTVQRHETEIQNGKAVASDDQGEHWMNVVEMAKKCKGQQKHDLPDNWVILYKEDVAKAIDPGEKRASQLIDEWTDTDDDKFKQGTEKQPYKPPTNARNNRAQKKALKVDLDVWGENDE